MNVYVLTVVHNLDFCEVWGVFTSQDEAEEQSARLVGYFGKDIHEVRIGAPRAVNEGPLRQSGHM